MSSQEEKIFDEALNNALGSDVDFKLSEGFIMNTVSHWEKGTQSTGWKAYLWMGFMAFFSLIITVIGLLVFASKTLELIVAYLPWVLGTGVLLAVFQYLDSRLLQKHQSLL